MNGFFAAFGKRLRLRENYWGTVARGELEPRAIALQVNRFDLEPWRHWISCESPGPANLGHMTPWSDT